MLKNLLTRKERWKFAIIEDTLSCNGLALIKAFACHMLRDHEVHILCYDNVPDPASYMHDTDLSFNLYCHDGFSDPGGWIGPSPSTALLRYSSSLPDYFQSVVQSCNSPVVIVFHSLTSLLQHRPVNSVCRELHQLMNLETKTGKPPILLGLLHSDVHDENTTRAVHYLVDSTMTLSRQDHQIVCNTIHRRASGKVIKELEVFSISASLEVVDVRKYEVKKKQPLPEPNANPDPTLGLTFKLTLEEKEKEDRSQLVLPYTRVKEAVTTGAQIFYQPDANDDFDEEDPDEDLNI